MTVVATVARSAQIRKRRASNSANTAPDRAAAAADTILHPLQPLLATPLKAEEMPFWAMIIRARARDEWGLIELAIAAQLARLMAGIERVQRELDLESLTLVSDKGWAQPNPKIGIIAAMSSHQVKLLTTLRITGTVAGDPSMLPKRQAEREAEHTILRAQSFNGTERPPLLAT